MQKPPHGWTKPEAGVTATSPATRPEAKPRAVGLPRCNHSTSIQLSAAAAAATCVAAKAEVAKVPLVRPLPPLKPNQPNHRMPAPVSVNTMLLGWKECCG